MYTELFTKKLKLARSHTGLTQVEVAEVLGISKSTIASYEVGRTEPDLETLAKLAEYYEVSLDWLLSTSGKYAAPK